MTANQADRTELTTNNVAQVCANNETRLLLVASAIGINHRNSWYIAASEIARELNITAADPEATLHHILSQLA
jgi:hypothetical protein